VDSSAKQPLNEDFLESWTNNKKLEKRKLMKKKQLRFNNVPESLRDLTGKTVVFTGGTDGMGRVAVDKLAQMGAKVVVLGRNETKSQAVVYEVNEMVQAERALYVHCDLASQASIHTCAQEILERCPRIDILVNCAGANFSDVHKTEDGIEIGWAVNHLAPLLLTHLLLERLKESAPSRIIHLSSATEKYGHIHLDDIHLERTRWAVMKSYPQAKLAMIMCTRKLAQELEGTGVTVNALNPGWIKTDLAKGKNLKGWMKFGGLLSTSLFGEPPEAGADRIVTLAIAPQYEGVSGQFVYEDHIRKPNPQALDDALVEQVWSLSLSQIEAKF
jgi:NAD(P)-dependent dehydrogenase (short-subunit alcohol dehydrogenase family)